MMQMTLLVALIAGVAAYLASRASPARRGEMFRRAAAAVLGLTLGVFALFLAGETVDDPGGWRAAGLVALWAAPLAALAALAWWRPGPAAWVLGALTVADVAFGVWAVAAEAPWRTFEDAHGPVRAIVAFVTVSAVAVLGWRRPRVGGWLLLVAGGVPVVLGLIAGMGLAGVSWTAVGAPAIAGGLLYLLAARFAAGRPTRELTTTLR